MKRLVLVAAFVYVFSISAQDWGGWGGGGGDAGSSGSKDKGTVKGSGSSGSTSGSGSSGSSGGGATDPSAPKAPEVVIPTIGLHYDDPVEAHREAHHGTINDGVPKNDDATVVAYPYLREADAKFKRRIWRVIDTRQKFNKAFTWPKNPVTQILWDLPTKGKVRAYATDSLDRILTPEDILKAQSTVIPTQIPCPGSDDPDCFKDTFVLETFKWYNIQKFEIMEDWIFDFKHSVFKPKIIAIAPIKDMAIGGVTYPVKIYWLKMDDLRPTLAKSEVYNRYNDVMRVSWDDAFNHFRLFDSYIVKQTDWDDRYIYDKPEFKQDGLGSLIEGERIKNDLFIFEHDLWEF